jgi:hypothetical protein
MWPPFPSFSTSVSIFGVVTCSLPNPAAFKLPRSSLAALISSACKALIPACMFAFQDSSAQLGVVAEGAQPSAMLAMKAGCGIAGNCGAAIGAKPPAMLRIGALRRDVTGPRRPAA